ncbi:hypothetical protein [Streptomyces venezuelae]|uniref:hypothetical protein n=1 Tax=Streptomyces venezuelae TaxID=54571 RepID=UPI00341254AB
MAKSTAHDAAVKSWHWYSRDHALAATLLCRRCAELEYSPDPPNEQDRAQGLTWSTAQAAEHRTYAMAAVLTAFAFLEASVNELLASAAEDQLEMGGGRGGLTGEERSALVDLQQAWGDGGPSLLDRAQLVLHLLRRPPFDRGEAPFQTADVLRRLRNALVHYRPEWRPVGAGVADDRIARTLASLPIAPHPFATEGHPFFPDRCLGHGLASWAWRTSLAFTDDFLTRVGVQPIYHDLRPRLTTGPAS